MGLNLHHSIMINKKRLDDNIPEYRYKSKYEACNEITMLQSLAKYNEVLRESQRLLWYHKRNSGKSIEGIVSTIYNSFQSTMTTVASATEKLKQSMAESIDAAIKKIINIESKSGAHTSSLSQFDKEQIIDKYLKSSNTRPSLSIVNIHPTNIMNFNYPNINILSNNKLFDDIKMMFLTHDNDVDTNNVSYNIMQSDDPDIRIGIMSNAVEEDKIRIISKLFNGHFYSEDNIIESARQTANIVFGNNMMMGVDFSKDLYAEACNNLININHIISGLEKNKSEYNRVYSEIIDKLQNLLVEVGDTLIKPANAMDLHTRCQYGSVATRIASTLQSAINAIDSIINANYIIFAHKLNRICSIIDSSYKIKSMGDTILHKCGKSSISKQEYDRFNDTSIFYGSDYTTESSNIINKMNIDFLLLSEMIEDNILNKDRYSILLEAEGDNNQANPQQFASTQNNAQNNTQNDAQSTSPENYTSIFNKAKESANKLMHQISTLYSKAQDKFRYRFNELIIKNKNEQEFWKKNKEAVLQLGSSIGNTKVNEWYKYDIKAITNFQSIQIPEFDSANDIFKSNEAFVEFMINKVNGTNLGIDKNDSFATMFTKIYQGGPMVQNSNGGEELNKVGYNHNEVVEFITTMVNGNLLNSISNDDKILKQFQDKTQSEYKSLLEKLGNAPNNNTSTSTNSSPIQAKQESAVSYNDFSLTKCFGLPQKNHYTLDEATYEIDKATTQQAAASGISNHQLNEKAKNIRILNDMIRRYMLILVAITSSRMTCAIAAYKQYSGLFKAIRDQR